MPTHIEQELGIAPTTNRIRRWFRRFMPSADRSLDPLTVNYEVWRAISKSIRKWPTYQEAPNYIEVLVSPEDWGDYWGVDTTRKEAGVSAYLKARIVEKGLWVAGEPQVLVFEDETIEMGELEISCQFVEPMTTDEVTSLRSGIDHEASYQGGESPYFNDGATKAWSHGKDDSFAGQGTVLEAPVIEVVDAQVERVEDGEPSTDDSRDRVVSAIPDFLAAQALVLAEAKAGTTDIEVQSVAPLADEPKAEPDAIENDADDDANDEGMPFEDVAEEPLPIQDYDFELDLEPIEPIEPETDLASEAPVEDEPPHVAEVSLHHVATEQEDPQAVTPASDALNEEDLPPIPELDPDAAPNVDVEMTSLPSRENMASHRPVPTVRFVDAANPGNLYLVGEGSFRLEIHSGDCIGAVRIGDSVPAQVNVRIDADGFPYAETMQCSIVVEGGRWCVVNHAVHGTRLTKVTGARYLLGSSDPCVLDHGDLLWLGHEKPLRVEY